MVQQKIQLRKLRDFGENFSDTFQFIRQEFKPLMTSFLLIGGVFILATAIVAAFFQQQAWSVIMAITKGVYTEPGNLSSTFTPGYFLMILLSILTLSAMRNVVAVYMDYYDEHQESPTVGDVWQRFIRYLLPVFIFAVGRSILVAIGLVLCVVPGVYLLIVLMPFSNIIVSEKTSIGNTFSRCFELIKENFWTSFAIYLIAYLIFSVSAGIIGFIASLIGGGISYFTTRQTSTTVPVVAGIMNVVEYLFYIIFFISAGLQYYNLAEARDATGLTRRLEDLGGSGPLNNDIEEQY